MGNAESVAVDINIHWAKNGPKVAQAGQLLQGEVIVHVKKRVDNGAPIKLILSGKERIGVKVQKRAQMVFTDAERRFFSATIPLHSFKVNCRVLPGDYSFPFAIKLPRSLPSSDKHPNDWQRGKIGYHILYRMTAKMGELYKEVHFDVQSAPLGIEDIPCLITPTQHQIQSFGFKGAGRVILGALVNNSVVGRGKNIKLLLACRNDSTISIRSVEIQIVEYLRWSLGSKTETTEVFTVLKSVKSVALPPTCKACKSHEVGKKSTGTLYKEIHEELRTRKSPLLITVPETARDTYRGQLVNIWHCLKIRYSTGTFSSDATTIVPIRIGDPPPRYAPKKYPMKQPHSAKKTHIQAQRQAQGPVQPVKEFSGAEPLTNCPGSLPCVPEHDVSSEGMSIIAPEDLIIIGAGAITYREGDSNNSIGSSVVTNPPEKARPLEVSLSSLLSSMESSINEFDLILGYLTDRRWVKFFANLTPNEFGQVVAAVKVEVDQPRVAVQLAPHINGGCFTCEYAAAAIRNCSAAYRTVTTKRLVPACVDLKQKYPLILKELNEWERIATSEKLDEVMIY